MPVNVVGGTGINWATTSTDIFEPEYVDFNFPPNITDPSTTTLKGVAIGGTNVGMNVPRLPPNTLYEAGVPNLTVTPLAQLMDATAGVVVGLNNTKTFVFNIGTTMNPGERLVFVIHSDYSTFGTEFISAVTVNGTPMRADNTWDATNGLFVLSFTHMFSIDGAFATGPNLTVTITTTDTTKAPVSPIYTYLSAYRIVSSAAGLSPWGDTQVQDESFVVTVPAANLPAVNIPRGAVAIWGVNVLTLATPITVTGPTLNNVYYDVDTLSGNVLGPTRASSGWVAADPVNNRNGYVLTIAHATTAAVVPCHRAAVVVYR